MPKKLLAILFISIVLLSGCGTKKNVSNELKVLPPENADQWLLSERLSSTGEGNLSRVVTGSGLGADSALEITTGGQGQLKYAKTSKAEQTLDIDVRIKFLSTQGTGRIKIEGLDAKNNVIGTIGWLITGNLADSTSTEVWLDKRFQNNYSGQWIEFSDNIYKLYNKYLPNLDIHKVKTFRVSVLAGEGQHALITKINFVQNISNAISITPGQKQLNIIRGETAELDLYIKNLTNSIVRDVDISIKEPFGYGIVCDINQPIVISELLGGEIRHIKVPLRAVRSDSVNLSKPWQVGFIINNHSMSQSIAISVKDERPGKIFYVMTEDLEPIDSAGYAKKWGNANGWLEPEEMQVQMINKSERMNSIADKYGAKWTHYIAWPVVRAADFIKDKYPNSKFKDIGDKIRKSVKSQAKLGHEYALHMHSDYDPYLKGNVLSYNSEVDGFWANHLNHGWAHSISDEGSIDQYDSRAGILFSYQSELDKMAEDSPQGQIINARAGSFDFGNGKDDEAKSIRAYQKVGILGSSDADGNAGGITSGSYENEIYLTGLDDINTQTKDISHVGLVEFRPTPRMPIMYDGQSEFIWNDKVMEGIKTFTAGGTIKPGVHAIVGFTHAMFIMGEGDYKSLEGGYFSALDRHLSYLKTNYVDNKLLTFATASELVAEYLDYYTPTLRALYGNKVKSGILATEYKLRLLGKDIPVDNKHTHTVSVKYPRYLRESAYRIVILKNNNPIYATWGLPTPDNDIFFTVDDMNASYTLKIYHNPIIHKILSYYRIIKSIITKNL